MTFIYLLKLYVNCRVRNAHLTLINNAQIRISQLVAARPKNLTGAQCTPY